jgi:aryl-alcohol dehydrogenase-like predicted oxidoreductase
MAMDYTTLGNTKLRVSTAGLGTGGFSRLGLKSGKSLEESARLIHEAVALGVNFIDTAASYGTEPVIGVALKTIPRDQVVIATKSQFHRGDDWMPPEKYIANFENSLRQMGTDHVDVFNVHGVELDEYDYARDRIVPALLEEKRKGKIRHIGMTENPIVEFKQETLKRALNDPAWEVFMVGFHMMHQGARDTVFPQTRRKGIGTLLMFAVRSMFADPPRIAREMKALADKGLVEKALGDGDDPLGFLVHDGGAASLTEAAYRYARHDSGADLVLFGTGDSAHLKANIAALTKPPLPQADRDRIARLFGQLTGIGLDSRESDPSVARDRWAPCPSRHSPSISRRRRLRRSPRRQGRA